MKNVKPGQRLAYYEVTGLSDPPPSKQLEVGSILIDRPRGKETTWDFMNIGSGENGDWSAKKSGWIAAKRIGFARVAEDGKTHLKEPGLVAYLDKLKAEQETSK